MSTPNQPNPETDQASKGLIMVVEHEQVVRESVEIVLELDNYEVLSVATGKQALESLHTCAKLPELIVSDVKVPDMGGLELLEEVRKERAWMRIPFLFLWGEYMEPRPPNMAQLLSVGECLQKPFDAEELLRIVETLLKRRREIS